MTPALTFCGECGCALPDVPEAKAIHERWHDELTRRFEQPKRQDLPAEFYRLSPKPPRNYYHHGSQTWEVR